jgi:hypothetical protein
MMMIITRLHLLSKNRILIVVFTSTAFTTWVAEHVTNSGNTAFNPYLTFLFYALYVFFFCALITLLLSLKIEWNAETPLFLSFSQCWSIGNPFHWLFLIPRLPLGWTLSILMPTLHIARSVISDYSSGCLHKYFCPTTNLSEISPVPVLYLTLRPPLRKLILRDLPTRCCYWDSFHTLSCPLTSVRVEICL